MKRLTKWRKIILLQKVYASIIDGVLHKMPEKEQERDWEQQLNVGLLDIPCLYAYSFSMTAEGLWAVRLHTANTSLRAHCE